MLKYIREGLKLSVLIELEHQDLKLKSFDQIVKKTVDLKAKLALRTCSSTKKIDLNYPRDNQLANFTIAKSQSSAIKDPWLGKFKVCRIELSSGT